MTKQRALRAKTPADLLALVPCVLGFHPEDSVVLLSIGREGRQVHARVDLPEDDRTLRELASSLLVAVRRAHVRQVALVVYSDDQCLALETVGRLRPELEGATVEVVVCLRADGERWFSLDGCDDGCCPVDGTPYDVAAHEFTAQSVLDGQVTYRSRQELADSLVGTDPDATEAVGEAADEAMRRFQNAARHPLGMDAPDGARQHLVTAGLWVRSRVRRYVSTREPLDADEAGRMLVALVNIEVRDVAWAEISRKDARVHVELWRDLVRRTPLDLAAAPAALLGFAAWLAGDGALAWCAVERCQEAEPDYSLAALLTQALTSALDPATWERIPTDELTLFTG